MRPGRRNGHVKPKTILVDYMKHGDLQSMSTDELWDLHERIVAELGSKMAAERDMLESRLRQLKVANGDMTREKRPYPKVLPRYRNPKNHEETWAGRGKQPRWLTAQLRSGKNLTDFLIR
jgi:DNA-binding protein H-NS